jgi:hypothetical protein
MISVGKPLFKLGQVVATQEAIRAMQRAGASPWPMLSRHVAGDWGDLSHEDKHLNDEAVTDGSRILSAYHLADGTKLWVITEAEDDHGQRAATTILTPDEY